MADAKQKELSSLSESDFRSDVLVPLFKAMGFLGITVHHGALEFGKDIVFFDEDRFGDRIYYAVVAKKGRIHGAVGKTGNASEVLFQAEQALGEPWLDPFNMTRHQIHWAIVAASGHITQPATLSIEHRAQGQRIRFMGGERIVALIDQHAPHLWQRITSEPLAIVPAEPASDLLIRLRETEDPQERWRQLEALAKQLFESIPGFVDVVANVRSSTEEIDLMFRNESSDPFWNQQGPFIMVECKSWKMKVPRRELDVFASKMSRRAGWCRLGFFVSLSGFTKDFYATLRHYIASNVLIVPIDGERLAQLCSHDKPKILLKKYVFITLNT